MTKSSSINITYFNNLDALRFFAFFLVLAQHSGLKRTLLSITSFDFFRRIISLMCSGDKGVSFFFVLSGFLITYLLLREYQKNSHVNILFFYSRRILRIWPLYYFVLLLGFVVIPEGLKLVGYLGEFSNRSIYYLFFLGNFDIIHLSHENLISKSSPVVGITWSVAIEEQFYLFWPLIFLLKRTYFKYAFIAIVLISLIFRLIHHNDSATLYYHTLSVFSDFAVGGFLAYLSIEYPSLIRSFSRMGKQYIILAYCIGIYYLLYGVGFIINFVGLDRLLTSIVFAFIILEQCFSNNSVINLGKMKFISYLGKISYGLYLYHFVGILIASGVFKLINLNSKASFYNGIIYFLVCLAATTLIASLSYRYYESYFLRLKDKLVAVNQK